MAQAWAFPGTGQTGNSGMLADVLTGLDWMRAKAYTPTTPKYNNWWDWEIGSPQLLLDAMCLVYAHLSAAQISGYLASVDQFVPDSKVAPSNTANTGANRSDQCRIVILRGILGETPAKIALGRDGLSPTFPLVRSGDGFYADGSFIQHAAVPYIGTYGFVLVNGLALLMALLDGSTWAVTDPNRQAVLDAVPKAIAPFLFNGLMMDGVSGRATSRGISEGDTSGISQSDHARGHSWIAAVLLLASAAPDADAARWRRMAKGWIQRDYYFPPMTNKRLSLPALAQLKSVLDDGAVTPLAEPAESRVFGSMDRATHRRPGWAFAVAMGSGRTNFYEVANGENPRGWHTNSGMTYWWGDTYGNGQYSDAFWPTVDPQRLPGTTVSRKPLVNSEAANTKPPAPAVWTGGATDGTYSALGQDTRGVNSTLTARKSWFCLSDQVVCLGAGITASDGQWVYSTVENRNLGPDGTQDLTVDGTVQPATLGWSKTFSAAGWAAIEGFGGYVFPGKAQVSMSREARTGAWRDINPTGSTTALTRRYVTLWMNHGTDPVDASYRYILMPGATAAQTAARAANPTVTVLANTKLVQAVTDSATGVTAANFYAAGTAGPITVSGPCSVLMRESGGTLKISVADPTRAATTVTVTIDRSGFSTAASDTEVGVIGLAPIKLQAEVGGAQGGSRTITFGTGSTVTAGRPATVSPGADAYVRDGSYASTNYGTDTGLHVKNAGAGYHRRAFLRFDLSSLTAAPRRAVLWVRGQTADAGGTQATVGAYAVSGDGWTETGLTWNNQPALGALQSTGAIGTAKDWIALDVTDHIRSQYSGDKSATVALAQAAPGNAVVLASREQSADRPFLQVIQG
ncbi:polysaccharide lyase 8 family protein [Streptomyces sp. TRM66268-LWL]|uniref:Polysaccharide lyase 8 family protein n=1 Tax=Streptomyces polyasparticus TaxID=2767826 RepID=A0ABR7SCD5_9ACTN|nr:polysaccharide lyase family 8 super-sandwich domain-containing protein [Streptomyces polyasparticus]MBC9713145.1 polysaccharide lyase 8 family protein [Streptomyces polyasparticus]